MMGAEDPREEAGHGEVDQVGGFERPEPVGGAKGCVELRDGNNA